MQGEEGEGEEGDVTPGWEPSDPTRGKQVMGTCPLGKDCPAVPERRVLFLRGGGLAPGAEEGQGSLPRLYSTRPKPFHLGAHLEPTVQDHLHRPASLTVTGEGGTRHPKQGPPLGPGNWS